MQIHKYIFATLFIKVFFIKVFFIKVYIKDILMRLSLSDYISILKFYNIDASHMKKGAIKQKAEAILAEKLCRCIKKVGKSLKNVKSKENLSQKNKGKNNKESRAIAICKNSILTKKNVSIAKFKCKGTARLLPSKNKHDKLTKRLF